MLINLGINSASINYEVALEVLGQSRQPIMTEIRNEKLRENPSVEFLKYCEFRLFAIDNLQANLTPTDTTTIERILDKENRASWL